MTKPTRGRPRKVDPKYALNAALELFWAKGFEGTSMNDIVKATGMAKPGIYANFGDKEELYAKALKKYAEELGKPRIEQFVNSEDPVKVAVEKFMLEIVSMMLNDETPCGCFLVNTLVESEGEIPKLEKLSRKFSNYRREAFMNYFKKAQKSGALKKTLDPEEMADFFAGQIMAIALLAKSGADKNTFENFVKNSVKILEV